MGVEVIEDRISRSWMTEERIIMSELKPNVHVSLEDAKSNIEIGQKLMEDGACALCVDISEIHGMDGDARRYYTHSNKQEKGVAVAIVVKSRISEMIANFFIGINRPSVPIKLFADRNDAFVWLRKHLQD